MNGFRSVPGCSNVLVVHLDLFSERCELTLGGFESNLSNRVTRVMLIDQLIQPFGIMLLRANVGFADEGLDFGLPALLGMLFMFSFQLLKSGDMKPTTKQMAKSLVWEVSHGAKVMPFVGIVDGGGCVRSRFRSRLCQKLCDMWLDGCIYVVDALIRIIMGC